jgi:diguanylate cyclase (GGDEF)-like protein
LVGAGVAEADLASERMVKAIRNASIKGAGDSYVSLSIGTATCPEHADSVERLIEAADQGLYLVKQAGRNGAKRLPTKAERDAAAGQP